MIDFRSTRETRASSFDYIQVRIASPEEMRGPKDPKEREKLRSYAALYREIATQTSAATETAIEQSLSASAL